MKIRRIIRKASGIWLWVDGIGTLIGLAGLVLIAIHTGLWQIGVGVVIFELIGMLNSFYAGRHMINT